MTKEQIKALYSVSDILQKYGVNIVRGKALCPFHAEKTPSLSIKDDFCHCFGCGRHDDIFSLTMHFERCDFKTAIEILGGDKKPTLTAYRRSKDIKAENERKKREREEKDQHYQAVWNEWARLDKNKRDYAPPIHKNLDISKLTDQEFEDLWETASHPLYVEACHKIDYQGYLTDCL